jgi:ribosome-associated toxin RatA of RatAB toxin-antitoxin module
MQPRPGYIPIFSSISIIQKMDVNYCIRSKTFFCLVVVKKQSSRIKIKFLNDLFTLNY